MSDELLPNYRKPVGEAGKIVIEKMYVGHAAMTREFVDLLQPQKTDIALDVGCGGGLALSLIAAKASKVHGIDYSEVSVEKARDFNQDAVRNGNVVVEQSDILNMPFADSTFSLVTAIETVYFWDRVEDCYARIYRALKPCGRFAILCEAWRDGDLIVNEHDGMDALGLQLYSCEDFTTGLKKAGFNTVQFQLVTDERCLCVITRKE